MSKIILSLGLASLIAAGTGFAAQAQCPPLPEGMLCAAENGDPRAMYMIGREAYDKARQTGDFSAAYLWAKRAKEAGFLGGKMLYKMVHLQAGDGLHHDYVEAHQWLSQAIADGDEYLVPWRRRLEAKMTAEQIAQAHRNEAQ
jgi:TPR repeat protein